jgi:quercetin dioxygenase-like cupin family protein
MKYTKIFTNEDEETHFTDVEIKFESDNFAPPAPPLNRSPYNPATQYAFLLFPSGWFGDWHPTPCKQIFFILSGECEVQVSTGELRRFSPGSIILAEDTWGKGHVSKVVGSMDMVVAVVQLPD